MYYFALQCIECLIWIISIVLSAGKCTIIIIIIQIETNYIRVNAVHICLKLIRLAYKIQKFCKK